MADLNFVTCLKAEILKVGFVDKDGMPRNWVFDCQFCIPGMTVFPDGSRLYAGYTVEELRKISLLH